MSEQWAVVFFDNWADQTMTDAVGPFRSRRLAEEALEKMSAVIHIGGAPQLVRLHRLPEALHEFSAPLDQREGPDQEWIGDGHV